MLIRSARIGPIALAALLVLVGTILTTRVMGQSPEQDKPFRVEAVSQPEGWNVYQGDDLILGYRFDSGGKPIVYPLHGPAGQSMTRHFPMTAAAPGERDDHDHHRSMWLTHGDVNGVDFWLDDKGCGKIVHRSGSAKVDDTGRAVIVTENDWLDPDGQRLLSDTRRLSVGNEQNRRIIDCDFLLKADEGDVNFGDTKEGTFGIRIAGSMKVDAKPGGQITNAAGETDAAAWGKQSPWVDYSGPIDGQTVGITIHDHPSSFGFPCRWHVRNYGLFAANPFGLHHFTGGEKTAGIVLKSGAKLRLNYRVVLHQGELAVAQTEADSKQYANDPRPTLE